MATATLVQPVAVIGPDVVDSTYSQMVNLWQSINEQLVPVNGHLSQQVQFMDIIDSNYAQWSPESGIGSSEVSLDAMFGEIRNQTMVQTLLKQWLSIRVTFLGHLSYLFNKVQGDLKKWKENQRQCSKVRIKKEPKSSKSSQLMDEESESEKQHRNMREAEVINFQSFFDYFARMVSLEYQMCLDLTSSIQCKRPDLNFTINFEIENDIWFRLIQSSVLVVEQPPQIVEKDRKFKASIRVLLSTDWIGHGFKDENVNVSLINSTQVADVKMSGSDLWDKQTKEEKKNLTVIKQRLEQVASSAIGDQKVNITIDYDELLVKREDRENVLEKLFGILFQVTITINGETHVVKAVSLPIIIVTNYGIQSKQAAAAIIWSNTFTDIDNPFSVPQSVTWYQMKRLFANEYKKDTKVDLSEPSLEYLGGKLFQSPEFSDSTEVPWQQFSKHKMTEEYTFWFWFASCLEVAKLYSAHFTGLKSELFKFISRDDTKRWLISCLPGTFLIRFSETCPGCVTVSSFNGLNLPIDEQIADADPKDLTDKFRDFGLAFTIHMYKSLNYLWPDEPKSVLSISKDKRKELTANNGYKKTKIFFSL